MKIVVMKPIGIVHTNVDEETIKNSLQGVISITTRQYEALVRLAQASARIQLRNEVNEKDVERAIDLMMTSLQQFGYDIETGSIDIDKAEGQKITAEHRSKIRIIEEIIEAARYAPSPENRQPWRFIVVTNKHRIKELSNEVKKQIKKILKNKWRWKRKYPELITPDSPTQRVGEKPAEGFKEVRHFTRLYSLDNTYSEEEVLEFHNRVKRLLGVDSLEYVCELKIDGLSIFPNKL